MKLRDNPDAVLSPYLRDHISNPVDWWTWGPDAFAEAAERDLPVMLSVGYAACHWCHVMAHESFEDPSTAAYLNEHFVSIKVDREERPDVDSVYMQITQDLTGHGGWPMTVFLNAHGQAFYAGTYFPPQSRGGMPSFMQILEAITVAWRDRRAEVNTSAESVTAALAAREGALLPGPSFDASITHDAVAILRSQFDDVHAGFGSAPKFPPSNALQFLARHIASASSADALEMLDKTCRVMALGGMYDQLGGGFARYSVDRAWVVPHFEKMLYDNALLVSVYTAWSRLTDDPLPARVVRESVEFMLRELRTPEGAFASALDADSDGREGAFYVWTPDELVDVLGTQDGQWAADIFAVTAEGTFEEGASTLQLRPGQIDDSARFERVREALFNARASRPRPATDDKVVTAWNGLAIAALAEAGAVFNEPRWIEAAAECATFLWNHHVSQRSDGSVRLARMSRGGIVSESVGVLDDYGDLASGLLLLFSATGDAEWVARAGRLIEAADRYFTASEGGFFDTASDAEMLVARPRDPSDAAYPSGASAIVGAMVSYAALTGDAAIRQRALDALDAHVGLMRRAPRFAGWWLAVGESVLAGPQEVAVVVPDAAPDALTTRFWQTPTAGAVLARGVAGQTSVALLADRPALDGHPTAYVCRDFVCSLPVTEPAALAALLAANT